MHTSTPPPPIQLHVHPHCSQCPAQLHYLVVPVFHDLRVLPLDHGHLGYQVVQLLPVPEIQWGLEGRGRSSDGRGRSSEGRGGGVRGGGGVEEKYYVTYEAGRRYVHMYSRKGAVCVCVCVCVFLMFMCAATA